MERAFRAYYESMAGLVARVMSAMAVGLGLDSRWFDPFIDRHTSALRALHYPDLAEQRVEPGQLRAGAHTDYGTLTLLRQDDAPGGLQLRGADDEWHDVPAVAGRIRRQCRRRPPAVDERPVAEHLASRRGPTARRRT